MSVLSIKNKSITVFNHAFIINMARTKAKIQLTCDENLTEDYNCFRIDLLEQEAIDKSNLPLHLLPSLYLRNDLPYGEMLDKRDIKWIQAFLNDRTATLHKIHAKQAHNNNKRKYPNTNDARNKTTRHIKFKSGGCCTFILYK